jgi:hypothetical protein
MAGNGNRLSEGTLGWRLYLLFSCWKGENALHLYPEIAN